MSGERKEQGLNNKSLHRIVIKFQDRLDLPYSGSDEINYFFLENDIIPWRHLQKRFPGIVIDKLFKTVGPDKILEWIKKAKQRDPAYQAPRFHSYFVIESRFPINADEFLQTLRENENVELAYVESSLPPPSVVNQAANPLSIYQGYLNPAPEGTDIRYAWTFKGGDGRGSVKFIDIEQGWILDHEDIRVGELPSTGLNQESLQEHGTAVLGIVLMQDNNMGGIGITPNVDGYVISQWRPDGSLNTSDAIMAAIDQLHLGDILLLEAQTFDFPKNDGAWPIEIQDATFSAIRLATALGIIVIEAAGNGDNWTLGSDLGSYADFNGRKKLDMSSADFKDSGAIMVAAASSSVPHSKMNYSNYGSRVDCYAWGENVFTAGNFPKDSGIAINMYSNSFGGTSAASAIIAGVAIAVQTILESNQQARLDPGAMRAILNSEACGTVSANGHAIDNIGMMPDLRKIINRIKETHGVRAMMHAAW